jgi:hypothetical protein
MTVPRESSRLDTEREVSASYCGKVSLKDPHSRVRCDIIMTTRFSTYPTSSASLKEILELT